MRLPILLVLVAGCTLEFVENPKPDPMDDPPPLTTAQKAWLDASAVLQAQCVACHASQDPSIGFLAGNTIWEMRDTLLASGMVNLADPPTSRIITKGTHSGPSMTATATSEILEWIVAERDEQH